ncbi:hypothetical protein ACFXPT_37540 [Streptomyces goshikiensis]|uniref:hypothetical protein n=1 Tax=Streptomyces goshikiensis TaxID=1942 RepID=UPI003686F7D4
MGNGLKLSERGDHAEREAEAVSAEAMAAPAPASREVEASFPGTECGAEHRVGAGVDTPVQRKVGYEFETNMPVRAGGKQIISKNEKIFEAASGDWYITPDSSMLEFVTVPFEEEGDTPERARMTETINEMAHAFITLHRRAAQAAETAADTNIEDVLSTLGTTHRHNGRDVYVSGEERVYPPTAKPQATGGVSLASIPTLFQAVVSQQLPLASPSNLVEVELLGDDPEERDDITPLAGGDPTRDAAILRDARRFAEQYTAGMSPPAAGAAELTGLVELVISYLLAGARQSSRHDQAKYFLPLMSRMSFSSMYATLPEEAKAAFDPAGILAAAGLAPDEALYAKGFQDRSAGDADVSYGPGRKLWLGSITGSGPDLMSAGSGSTVTEGMKASSPALGQHHRLDPEHHSGAGALVQIELRRLPGGVPPQEWQPLASTIFELFRKVQGAAT